MRVSAISWRAMLAISAWIVSAQVLGATVMVSGVTFDPSNGTTQASIVSGGYATPFGLALSSGGSDDWDDGQSHGTYFQVPTFQSEYDLGAARPGNVGSSVTLGSDPNSSGAISSVRDIISTKWATGLGVTNGVGNDLAIFEKAISEAYAIRAHNVTTGMWMPCYYGIFNQSDSDPTPREYDLTDLGVAAGQVIDVLETTNLDPDDTVASSIYNYAMDEFDGLSGLEDLGFGVVTFGGQQPVALIRPAGVAILRWPRRDSNLASMIQISSVS